MPIRIEIYAPDIIVGTAITEFALSRGAALAGYSIVEQGDASIPGAPTSATTNGRPKGKGLSALKANPNEVQYKIARLDDPPLRKGTTREKAYKLLRKKMSGLVVRRAVLDLLREAKYGENQIPSIVHGLEKAGCLIRA